MSAPPEILVACVGNVFHGDDGFGVEVARRLTARGAPPGARVVDFGIRGLDLAFALSSGVRAAILVDASSRGRPPGTLYVLDPGEAVRSTMPDGGGMHALHPLRAIALARRMGPAPEVMRVVACEPERLGDDDEPVMGLSPRVDAAVDGAIALVDAIVHDLSCLLAEAPHA